MPWDPFLMKKLMKSGICESINSTLMHCLLQKSQYLRLLFNEQYMNSNRVSPKRMEKKRTKTQNTDVDSKRRRGSKHILYVSGSQPKKKKKKKKDKRCYY